MGEVWKPIKDYEGYYEVSNLGRIRSLDRYVNHKSGTKYLQRGIVMAPRFRGGYVTTALSKFGHTKYCRIHRLVAQAFIPNPENKPTVNHMDGNKMNNTVENLEWATQSENQLHAIRTGLVSQESLRKAVYARMLVASKPVYCVKMDKHFPSIREASRSTGMTSNIIRTSIRENRSIFFRKGKNYFTFRYDN